MGSAQSILMCTMCHLCNTNDGLSICGVGKWKVHMCGPGVSKAQMGSLHSHMHYANWWSAPVAPGGKGSCPSASTGSVLGACSRGDVLSHQRVQTIEVEAVCADATCEGLLDIH